MPGLCNWRALKNVEEEGGNVVSDAGGGSGIDGDACPFEKGAIPALEQIPVCQTDGHFSAQCRDLE